MLLRDLPLFHDALPTKMYECMAARRPVACRPPARRRLVERSGAGVVVPPEDPEALAAALTDLAGAPAGRLGALGEAARAEAAAHGRGPWLDRWESLLTEIAGR